jgi:hypothetical protein
VIRFENGCHVVTSDHGYGSNSPTRIPIRIVMVHFARVTPVYLPKTEADYYGCAPQHERKLPFFSKGCKNPLLHIHTGQL